MTWGKTSLRWLFPGMRVKRFAALAALGLVLLLVGVGVWFSGRGVAPIHDLARLFEAYGASPSVAGGVIFVAGLLLLLGGIRAMNRSVLSAITDPDRVAELVYQRRRLEAGPRIVALGGGTGLSRVLSGLRRHTAHTTAVVAATDDGGSTGRLRMDFGLPAVGDLVDCMAALAEAERMPELMQYRFQKGSGLKGHTFGNLFLVALHELTGDFAEATRQANRILNLMGSVWPSTPDAATLVADLSGGRVVWGECALRASAGRIDRVRLDPAEVSVMPEVAEAIRSADLLVLGPGSLYTSVIASFLPPAVQAAIRESPVPLVYVANIMTEPGETDGYDAFDHLTAVERHLGRRPDVVLVHTEPIPEPVRARYAAEGRFPVAFDPGPFQAKGVRVITGDFREAGPLAQHDPEKVVGALVGLLK